MGCVTATAKRRRRQAVGGWMNLRPRDRPKFPRHSIETYEKRAAKLTERRSALFKRARKRST